MNPLFADVWVNLPSEAEEVPTNHRPLAQAYYSQETITFSYQGISYNIYLPMVYVYYNEFSNGEGHRGFHWRVEGSWGGLFIGWIFFDYAEFSVGIRVPENFKPTADVDAFCSWYRDYVFYVHFVASEYVYDIIVDPPGAAPLPEFHPTIDYNIRKRYNKHE